MRRKIAVVLCAKLALLTLLWALFFSPSHRIAVDSEATRNRFGIPDGRFRDPIVQLPIAKPIQPERLRD